jgi:hypothetical protein
MGTEQHDHDQRIADALRFMADDEGRLTSPPANLWGRIERAIDDPTDATGTEDGLVTPPDDLWDRIAEDVRAEGAASVVAPGGVAPIRRHQRRSVLGLVAAAVLVIAALAGAAVVLGRGTTGDTTQLVARASLSGAGLDPGGDSTGAAELLEGDAGWKVAIEVDDLPDAPDGSYYEAWLLGPDGSQVQSLGALEGNARLAVPDGLAIDDFPLVDVSIEPIDGDPGHSSKSVLRGELETA